MGWQETLGKLRFAGGEKLTEGLSDGVLAQFAGHDDSLVAAIEAAGAALEELKSTLPDLATLDEAEQIAQIQSHLINFYPDDAVNPYVALAARGPWIVTTKGAVIHDSGGYGMLGMGHAPRQIIDAMARPHVMANVMTPSFSQLRFSRALRQEIGRGLDSGCPFDRFVCVNSGSESVSVATRLADINAKIQTEPGNRHAGKTIVHAALKNGFHGRTDRPARFSDSSLPSYRKHLASFRVTDDLLTIEPNNVDDLRRVFARAEEENLFIEALFMEPVMGEGNPGAALDPAFYAEARALTKANNTLLLIDSIQAGLRAHGCLSIVDYPGFENLEAPDMETYSKALNAGQYPLSVLALNAGTAALYRKGVYGNTMTTNPRAMDVACAVLEQLTPAVRSNIKERGREFLTKLENVARESAGRITSVQGTGLLFSCELRSDYKCYGAGSTEEYLRKRGIGVIHGGENSLRFTPHFRVTSEEVDLIVGAVRDAIMNGPRSREEDLDRMAS